jgi:glycine oxidase
VPDVIIIGGGLIGMGVAWRTAQAGADVTVIDPTPGAGASHVAAGMVAPVTELHYGEEALLRLNLESSSMFPAFAAELEDVTGLPSGFHPAGTLAVAMDRDDLAALSDLYDFQRSLGLDVDRLTSRECRGLEPLLAPGICGGLFVADDHSADPRVLFAALAAAARRAGVLVLTEPVAEIQLSGDGGSETPAASATSEADGTPQVQPSSDVSAGTGDRVAGVRLASGELLSASTVVLAAGCWSASLGGLPAAAVPPVRPVKGQLLRLRAPARPETSAPPASIPERTVRAVVRGSSVYVVPRPSGEVVVGATTEELGFDTTVTAGAVYELLRDARTLIPTITELGLAEATAGLRPGSPDNAPILGQSSVPGLVIATGHYRNGVLLTPLTSALIAELVTTGRTPEMIEPFSPHRFSPAQAADIDPGHVPATGEAGAAPRGMLTGGQRGG